MQNSTSMLPMNIGLLTLTPENLRGLQQVNVLDIFETVGNKNFHASGLFSTEIFGKIVEEKRNRLYGYIDLKLNIIHPVVYKAIINLRELYGRIISGSAYAKFNKETKDFDPSNMAEGETGFSFFLRHFPELQFEQRESTSREFAIKMINKYRDTCLLNKLLVMPAGLRDFTIAPNGKPEEDEINNLYRRVISTANVIGQHGTLKDESTLDATRYGLQLGVNAIYEYIISLLEGKHKLIQGSWTSRKIFRSTRNVITANVPRTNKLFDELTIGPNQTVAGLYQIMMAIFPIAVNLVREIATNVFTGPNTPARLINKKTLESETVTVDPSRYDEWMTQEGIEQIFGRFEAEGLRQDVIEVEGRYFALLYNDGKRVKICYGISDLPEGFDKKYLTPITFAELFYLAIFQKVREIPAFVTRYPILGYGSIYPGWLYMKTTTKSQSLILLDDSWQETNIRANEFPVKDTPFVNSMSPAGQHLGRLGADNLMVN